jgi:hypothetical protein
MSTEESKKYNWARDFGISDEEDEEETIYDKYEDFDEYALDRKNDLLKKFDHKLTCKTKRLNLTNDHMIKEVKIPKVLVGIIQEYLIGDNKTKEGHLLYNTFVRSFQRDYINEFLTRYNNTEISISYNDHTLYLKLGSSSHWYLGLNFYVRCGGNIFDIINFIETGPFDIPQMFFHNFIRDKEYDHTHEYIDCWTNGCPCCSSDKSVRFPTINFIATYDLVNSKIRYIGPPKKVWIQPSLFPFNDKRKISLIQKEVDQNNYIRKRMINQGFTWDDVYNEGSGN